MAMWLKMRCSTSGGNLKKADWRGEAGERVGRAALLQRGRRGSAAVRSAGLVDWQLTSWYSSREEQSQRGIGRVVGRQETTVRSSCFVSCSPSRHSNVASTMSALPKRIIKVCSNPN